MRALMALVATLAVLAPSAYGGPAAAADDAEQAARQIADARQRANAAAEALFDAESVLDTLEVRQDALQVEIDRLQQRIDELQRTVEAVAVNRYTRSGTSTIPLLTGFREAGDQYQVAVLVDVANETSADDFDQYDELNAQLAAKRAALEQARIDGEAARDDFERLRREALEEVRWLKELEEERLQDEAVRNALVAELAERRRQEEALARAVAQEARQQSTVGAEVTGSTVAAEATASTVTEGTVAGEGSLDDDDFGDIDSSPQPEAASTSGSGGGLTGVIGAGGRPGASPGVLGGAGWICPVQGPMSFADTWGAPRSGGRTHQGVDMIAETGVPLVAVVDGVAQAKINTLGGNTVALTGADGTRYYYAHLSTWANLGPVTAGTVIGYVGATGNAQWSVPHLHFEIHPGGGAAVNPFPTVAAFC